MYACIHVPNITANGAADLLELAKSFSRLVEATAAGTVVLPADSLRRYIGPPHQIASEIARRARDRGLAGNIGLAHTPDTAILAARNIAGVTVIPKGAESKYLGAFRLETLPIDPEIYDVLDRWGIRTLEDFSVLPEHGIAERLGQAGVFLQKLARGAADRPLRPLPSVTGYEERFELEHELVLLEPLLFILARLLNELCDRLHAHSMATTEIRLRLELDKRDPHERKLQLPFATRDAKALLKLLQLDLEAHAPEAPVIAVALAVTPVEPRVVQSGLFVPSAPEPEKLELTLAKIRGMVGRENVGMPELLDTHRPGGWRLRREVVSGQLSVVSSNRVAFRYFTPILKARVELSSEVPRRVFAPGIYGNVLQVAGPWRTSGNWWTTDPWDRDDWEVGLNDGVIYRMYLRRPIEEWFIEGAYD
jgi:protein ImuB